MRNERQMDLEMEGRKKIERTEGKNELMKRAVGGYIRAFPGRAAITAAPADYGNLRNLICFKLIGYSRRAG